MASDLQTGRLITLDDPERAAILAEIQGRPLPAKTDRLNSVAQPTTIDGHRFPSLKEGRRYSELKIAERAGHVARLQLQVTIPLVVNGVPIFPQGYRADFVYLELQQDQWQTWKFIIEDCKGVRTDTYKIKRQLVLAIWGIEIRET